MRIKIIKPIQITEVGKSTLPLDFETNVSDTAGEILVRKKFAIEIKDDIEDIEVKESEEVKSKPRTKRGSKKQ